jgi:ABC-type nickel/cobalt efflux system permease component RcnA
MYLFYLLLKLCVHILSEWLHWRGALCCILWFCYWCYVIWSFILPHLKDSKCSMILRCFLVNRCRYVLLACWESWHQQFIKADITTNVNTHIQHNRLIHTHTQVCTRAHIHAHTHTWVCTCTHIHTHTCTYMPASLQTAMLKETHTMEKENSYTHIVSQSTKKCVYLHLSTRKHLDSMLC